MPRRAAGGARGGAELGAGLARVGWLEDFASAGRTAVVGWGFARGGAGGAIGQGFRAVHFVEVGFVDAGGGASATRGPPSLALPHKGGGNGGTTRGLPLTPTL